MKKQTTANRSPTVVKINPILAGDGTLFGISSDGDHEEIKRFLFQNGCSDSEYPSTLKSVDSKPDLHLARNICPYLSINQTEIIFEFDGKITLPITNRKFIADLYETRILYVESFYERLCEELNDRRQKYVFSVGKLYDTIDEMLYA